MRRAALLSRARQLTDAAKQLVLLARQEGEPVELSRGPASKRKASDSEVPPPSKRFFRFLNKGRKTKKASSAGAAAVASTSTWTADDLLQDSVPEVASLDVEFDDTLGKSVPHFFNPKLFSRAHVDQC
jgi:hypothetical protein